MSRYLENKLCLSPLDAMFTLLSFIFVKELHASALQLTLLVASKPIVGFFSYFGHVFIKNAPSRLKPYIIAVNVLGCIPCLFFPAFHSPWFFLISYALFIMSVRAAVPAWVELFKITLTPLRQAKLFSNGLIVHYVVTLLFPLLVSSWLDSHSHLWKWIFFLLGCLQIINVLLLWTIPATPSAETPKVNLASFSPRFFINLMRERPDFLSYQWMFLIGGVGLVAMQPALPIFYKETLNLSYMELTFATHFCKGICFALSAPIWARFIHKVNIFKFNYYINICSCLFVILLLCAEFNYAFICLAFAVYGLMQSGCELSWNLSGAIFSRGLDSTLYTASNLAFIAMRGCICPFIGQALLQAGPSTVFIFAGCTCFVAVLYALKLSSPKTERLVFN